MFRRYRRWVVTGVFDALLETLTEAVERDTSADMIPRLREGRLQHGGPGASLRRRAKKGDQEHEGLGRSRGGFTTKALLSLSKGSTPAAVDKADRSASS